MITVEYQEGRSVIIIHGDFDTYLAKDARELFAEVAESTQSDVEIDLKKTEFIDSSGIGALVFLHKRLRCKGFNIQLKNVQEQPFGLFTLLRIDQIMQITR